MRYYISDLHFYHANMNANMDRRGFASFEEMNEYMIEQWNKKVRKNDEVVILGDFSIAKGEKTSELLQRLISVDKGERGHKKSNISSRESEEVSLFSFRP